MPLASSSEAGSQAHAVSTPSGELSTTVLSGLRRLAADGEVELVVRGSCMGPGLPEGVRVRVARRSRYWPGDVIAFEGRRGELWIHRLIGYRLRGGRLAYVTRADTAPWPDAPVAARDVLGKLTACEENPRLANISTYDRLKALSSFLGLVVQWLLRRR